MGLKAYQRKRDFVRSPEPRGKARPRGKPQPHPKELIFVIQEHHARRVHWDFRLEAEGVLKSWAVTKEPLTAPGVHRLAIETEDHPLEYAKFHGRIPEGEYGAGTVRIWDHGTYDSHHPVEESMELGAIKVFLHGRKLKGEYVLARVAGEGARSRWVFFKSKPKPARLKIPAIASLPRKRRR